MVHPQTPFLPARPELVEWPVLSSPKGRSWFDKLTTNLLDKPFLGLSKGEGKVSPSLQGREDRMESPSI